MRNLTPNEEAAYDDDDDDDDDDDLLVQRQVTFDFEKHLANVDCA